MRRKYLQRSELYAVLVKAIEKKLREDKSTISEITTEEFGLSQRQFYYMKKFRQGHRTPGLSENMIKKVAEKIGLKVEARFFIIPKE